MCLELKHAAELAVELIKYFLAYNVVISNFPFANFVLVCNCFFL